MLPRLITRQQLAGAAASAGIGFTMALFVADLVLVDRVAHDEAKVGILIGSATASTLGWLLLNTTFHRTGGGRRRLRDAAGRAGGAAADRGGPA